MKVVCPIAGVGKRLQPFTFSKPKAFLKVAGKRLIDHILIKIKKAFPQGTELCFIVGYKKRNIIQYLTESYSDYFNLQFVEQEPLGYSSDMPYFSGLGDAILLSKNFVQNDEFFLFLSDRLPLEDYTSILLKYHQGECDAVINVKQVNNPQYYGVTVLDDQNLYIKKIVEKPSDFISNFAVSGAYLFGKRISARLFELLEIQREISLENGQEHQLTPVIEQLIEENYKIEVHEMKEKILDFGRPEKLLEGNRLLLSELKHNDPTYENLILDGKVVDSKIVPPVMISENVHIKDSVIGPNVSIGDDVTIEKCIISESVLGDGAQLKNLLTKNSIIGDYCVLEDLIKNSITIGDSCLIATSNNLK